MTDTRAERPAGQDHELQAVLALYAPLLTGLRAAAAVDRQISLLVDEAVTVWSRPGFDTFLSLPSLRFDAVRLPAAGGARRAAADARAGRSSPTRSGLARRSRPG